MMDGPTSQELTEKLQHTIDNARAELALFKLKTTPRVPMTFTTRILHQEIAAIEICPAHPEYVVIGTYALVKKNDEKDYPWQVRQGLLMVVPLSITFKPSYPGQLAPHFDKKKFPCAILDIHFHPSDSTLFGVATSNGQMHFYRFIKHADVIGRQVQLKLIALGSATVAENDEHGLIPLITQFTWLAGTSKFDRKDKNSTQTVACLATTSLNDVLLIKATLPAITTLFDGRLAHEPNPIAIDVTVIQRHSLEAWCVAASVVKTDGDYATNFILSGGDDSALIGSLIELAPVGSPGSLLTQEPHPLFVDKKTHGSGVVAILSLTPIKITDDPSLPPYKYVSHIITGSYDEYARVFVYDPEISRKKLLTEVGLGGGVWRLKLMDDYNEPPARPSTDPKGKYHALILASCMHGGVRILRVTHVANYYHLPANTKGRDQLIASMGWSIDVIGKFTDGHESMVYACDFKQEVDPNGKVKAGEYSVVSTSFYDMKVCVWNFVDEVKKRMEEERAERVEAEKRLKIEAERRLMIAAERTSMVNVPKRSRSLGSRVSQIRASKVEDLVERLRGL